MNQKQLVRLVTSVMREQNIRKEISYPKQVFHISDDEGNTKDFVVKKSDKSVIFTIDDIDAVINATVQVVEDLLKRGDYVSIRGFGSLALQYRKARKTKHPDTGLIVDVEARYIPKFTFGQNLRYCAKLYELSLKDKIPPQPIVLTDDSEDEDGDE